MKQAMSDQFNWIFVIIAGAVILMFFFSMIQRQQSLSISKTNAKIIRQIETVLTVAGSEPNTLKNLDDFNGLDILFQCRKRGNSCDCKYSSGSMSVPYDHRIIYAPKEIIGNQMILWTSDWKDPFLIDSLLYASNNRHKYIIVKNGDNSMYDDLKSTIREEFKVEYIDDNSWSTKVSAIPNNNYDSVTLLVLNCGDTCKPSLKDSFHTSFSDTVKKIVKVKPGNINELTIMGSKSTTRYYMDIQQVIGAMFSADGDMYECNTMKAFDVLSSVANVQKERFVKLKSDLITRGACSQKYQSPDPNRATAVSLFSSINTAASELMKSISSTSGTNNKISDLKSKFDAIKILNEELVTNDCPTIY